MSKRPSVCSGIRIVYAGLAALLMVSTLGACADGGSSPGMQYGGGAPDVNCQFGSPCGNAHGVRP
jgi:hypothetical protein